MSLTQKTCEPCRGGNPPLTSVEAQAFLRQTPRWSLIDEDTKIERTFETRDFATALEFVNAIGELAETEGHHPDIAFGWGYCRVLLYTHKINGLHENDYIMAAKISELAEARDLDL